MTPASWVAGVALAVSAVASLGSTEAARAQEGPRHVQVNPFVNGLSNIDSQESTFEADFYLVLRWPEPLVRGLSEEQIDWESLWQPHIEAVNSADLDSLYSPIWELVDSEAGLVQMWLRFRGTFNADFDLRSFPFDRQTFPIILESSTTVVEELLLHFAPLDATGAEPAGPYQRDLDPKVYLGEVLHLPEWSVEGMRVTRTVQHYRFDDTRWSRLRLDIEVARRPGFYIWNVVVVIIFLVVLSWGVFFLQPEDLSGRLAAALTLFLAAVAFGLVTNSILPRIPYLTMLDYYTRISHVLIVLTALESIAAQVLTNRGDDGRRRALRLDRLSMVLLPVLFLGLSLLVWTVI